MVFACLAIFEAICFTVPACAGFRQVFCGDLMGCDLKMKTETPNPETPNPKPENPNPKPQTLNRPVDVVEALNPDVAVAAAS